jgi:hypothetical protein
MQRFLSSARRAVAVVVPTTGAIGIVVAVPAVVEQIVAAVVVAAEPSLAVETEGVLVEEKY